MRSYFLSWVLVLTGLFYCGTVVIAIGCIYCVFAKNIGTLDAIKLFPLLLAFAMISVLLDLLRALLIKES